MAFRSIDKPGRLRDGWAESAWVATAKGLDVQRVFIKGGTGNAEMGNGEIWKRRNGLEMVVIAVQY